MSKQFEVTVVANVTANTVITVTASSREEAEAEAWNEAHGLDRDDWELGHPTDINVENTEELA